MLVLLELMKPSAPPVGSALTPRTRALASSSRETKTTPRLARLKRTESSFKRVRIENVLHLLPIAGTRDAARVGETAPVSSRLGGRAIDLSIHASAERVSETTRR